MGEQYHSAVKDEKKSKQEYDRKLKKGGTLMKQMQKDRLQKVALSNFSREDYQKSVRTEIDNN